MESNTDESNKCNDDYYMVERRNNNMDIQVDNERQVHIHKTDHSGIRVSRATPKATGSSAITAKFDKSAHNGGDTIRKAQVAVQVDSQVSDVKSDNQRT